ncbi:hypothetical protein KI387_019470, partial [Taxus chinensis]
MENIGPISWIDMAFDANQDPPSKKIWDRVSLTCQKVEGLSIETGKVGSVSSSNLNNDNESFKNYGSYFKSMDRSNSLQKS